MGLFIFCISGSRIPSLSQHRTRGRVPGVAAPSQFLCVCRKSRGADSGRIYSTGSPGAFLPGYGPGDGPETGRETGLSSLFVFSHLFSFESRKRSSLGSLRSPDREATFTFSWKRPDLYLVLASGASCLQNFRLTISKISFMLEHEEHICPGDGPGDRPGLQRRVASAPPPPCRAATGSLPSFPGAPPPRGTATATPPPRSPPP